MTHREAVDRFVAEMRGRGVNPWTSAPPLFRLLWYLGAKVPPPHFLPFATCALLMGSVFGLFLGIFMYGLFWGVGIYLQERLGLMGSPAEPAGTWIAVVVSGVFFGLSMAWYLGRKRKALRLPSWDRFLADGASLSGGASGAPAEA